MLTLDQGLTNISQKRPDSKQFGFCRLQISGVCSSILSLQHKRSKINKHGCMSKLHLWTLIFEFHVILIFLEIFFSFLFLPNHSKPDLGHRLQFSNPCSKRFSWKRYLFVFKKVGKGYGEERSWLLNSVIQINSRKLFSQGLPMLEVLL